MAKESSTMIQEENKANWRWKRKGDLPCDSQIEGDTSLNIKIHDSDTYTELQTPLRSCKGRG